MTRRADVVRVEASELVSGRRGSRPGQQAIVAVAEEAYTATPASSSTFTGWSGACSGTGPCTVTLDAAKTVTATFTVTATNCHPSYPTVCIPPPPPNLNCSDIPYRRFRVIHTVPNPDPHSFDRDRDGIGCES